MNAKHFFLVLFLALFGVGNAGGAQAELARITVSSPGPYNLAYLPIDLIPKIGADAAEGARLLISHVGGGGVALKNLGNRNVDFAAAGLPALMSMKSSGGDVVAIAAVDDVPTFVLMVRSDLKDKIKSVADLRGHVLGVNTSTQSAKTTSQQLLELLLNSVGVAVNEVNIVSAGQSWEEQHNVLKSRAVDAIMGDEPFASRLRDQGLVFFLLNLGNPEDTRNLPGVGFLHATLGTRQDVLLRQPAKADKMVAMLRRSLLWIASHTPEEVVAQLGLGDASARQSLVQSLKAHPRAFSRDGRFSTFRLRQSELFFQAANGKPVAVDGIVDDRRVGRAP